MTAAEIEPFHLVQKIAEIALDDFQRFHEGVCVLFAEGMEMQSVDACEICSMQRVSENAEAASFHAGIVDGVVLGRMHRIDAQSCAFSCCKDALLKMIPLGEAVEHDVVSIVQKLVEPLILIRRTENVGLAAHLLMAEARFKKSAGCGTTENLTDLRIALVDAERFLSEEDLGAAFIHDIFQDLQVRI